MKSFVLSVIVIALFHVNFYSQSFGIESEWIDAVPHELEYILTDQGRVEVTPIDTVRVDAIQNAAQMTGGSGCGAEWVKFTDIPEGLYAIAISGGPGISYDLGDFFYLACFLRYNIPGAGHDAYGLHGYGSSDDIRSYVIYRVAPGNTGEVRLFVADDGCWDNSGYVDVTLYEVNPSPFLFCDDFEDGDYEGWTIVSGIWDASSQSFCQTSNALPGKAVTEETFTWQNGFQLSANTFLVEPLSYKGRSVYWINEKQNSRVYMEYIGHVRELNLRCFVNGEDVYSATFVPPQSEWDGSDGLWHELKMQINGNHLQGWRDNELLFETWDDRLLQMPKDGNIMLHTWGSHTCFDDICLTNISE